MTYYDVLQVTQEASSEVISMAYKALAKKYHPDSYQEDKDYATHKMQQINEAYQVLSSPVLRNEYDKKLMQQTKTKASQGDFSTTYPTQDTNDFQKKPQSRKEKIFSSIKKILRGFIKVLVFCLSNTRLAIGIIFIIFIGLVNLGVFEKRDNSSTDVTTKTSYSSDADVLSKVDEPKSGTILSGYEDSSGSKITVTAPGGYSCVVKLKTESGTERLSFYVRAGDTATVGIPAEHLYIFFASGKDWYGTTHLFGESTSYSMDKEPCDFNNYTCEYTLQPAINGNFSQTIIDEEDFK